MNRIYDETTLASFARKLLLSENFQQGDFRLYTDVPVKCIGCDEDMWPKKHNPGNDMRQFTHASLDLVVCKDGKIATCVNFDTDKSMSKELFTHYLPRLDYLSHSAFGGQEDELEQLLRQVDTDLETYADIPFSLSPYLLTIDENPIACDLRAKHMVNKYGFATIYGRDMGLFFQLGLDSQGNLTKTPVTSVLTAGTLRSALLRLEPAWCQQQDKTVEEDTAALEQLLRTPLADFFCHEPWQLELAQNRLAAALPLQGFPGGLPFETYGDYIRTILALNNAMGQDNPDNVRLRQTANQLQDILIPIIRQEALCLAVPGLTEPVFQVFTMSLKRYFHACANMTDNYYPDWLYANEVRPYLNLGKHPEEHFTVAQWASYVHSQFQAEEREALFTIRDHLFFDHLIAPLYPQPSAE